MYAEDNIPLKNLILTLAPLAVIGFKTKKNKNFVKLIFLFVPFARDQKMNSSVVILNDLVEDFLKVGNI